MPYTYLAQPFHHDNLLVATVRHSVGLVMASHFMRQGHHIYAPIVYSQALLKSGFFEDGSHEFWLPFDESLLLGAADLWLLQLPGWEQSKGVEFELEVCHNRGLLVTHIPWGDIKAVLKGSERTKIWTRILDENAPPAEEPASA